MSFLRATCDATRGLQCSKETCKRWDGENLLYDMVFQTPRTHVISFSAPFSVVKQKHGTARGNTLVNSYLKIRNKDDRNFTPKMTFFRTLEIF